MEVGRSPNSQAEDAPNSLLSFSTSPIITIVVGKNKIKHAIHSEVLVRESAFFKQYLATEIKEGDSDVVELPEDSPKAFKHLVIWVYTRATNEDFPPDDYEFGMEDSVYPGSFKEAMEAWLLAHKMDMPSW